MIIPQGSTPSIFMEFLIGQVPDTIRIGKADGNFAGFGGTTSPQAGALLKINLAAGDTDVIGPITIVILDGTSNAIGWWYGVVLAGFPSTGDPLASPVPGAYGAGTAGKIIGDNLDAAVSTRLAAGAYTPPDNTEIVAIGVLANQINTNLTDGTYVIQLTTAQFDALVVAAWQTVNQIETGFTAQQAMRLILSALAGKVAISGSTVTIRNINDTITRITATTDAAGQRTAVTTNVS